MDNKEFDSAPIYKISHITDLLDVPEDRLAAFLDDLKNSIPTLRDAVKGAQEVNPKLTPKDMFPVLEWRDDNVPSTTIKGTINNKSKTVEVHHSQPSRYRI